jgi:hypothetical protein
MGVDRDWLFRELRHSLSLLAAEGEAALAGLPEGCCKPDELAIDFDHFRECVVGNFGSELVSDLVAALDQVEVALGRVPQDAWTEEAIRSHPAWAAIREPARLSLGLLDRFEGLLLPSEKSLAPQARDSFTRR